MKSTDFAIRLTSFLTDYLPAQRNVSPNTIQAYRDTFVLLLRYCRDVQELVVERLSIAQIDVALILAFLQYLERERHCGPSTRNQRLSAIHSFFRYVQTEEPERILQCQQILAIPSQRHEKPVVNYLPAEDLSCVLKQPDLNTPGGRRDAVLLSVLYDTGARVQELIDLCVRDVRLTSPAQIRITGKGRKERLVPLMNSTVQVLSEYMRERRLDRRESMDHPLFFGRRNHRLSRSGVRYILQKYSGKARATNSGLDDQISPHTLRHSKAMHLLQSGNPLTVISSILGHADTKTTEIYAKADVQMMRSALEKASDVSPTPRIPSWKKDKDLLDWLRSL